MAPNHAKALYFRGKSQIATEEFDQGIETLTQLCEIEPDNVDFKKELDRSKAVRAAYIKK